MNYTTNCRLPKWDEDDRIMMQDFNDAMDNIEAGITEAKAAVEEVRTELGAETQAQLQAIMTNLGTAGKNGRIVYGTYRGTGTGGRYNPTTLTFPITPVLVFVAATESGGDTAIFITGQTRAIVVSSTCVVSFSGKTVSWYHENNGEQLNSANTVYRYVSIGY